MGQKLTVFRRKRNSNPKGVFIAKNSIGIVTINGVKYAYNMDKLENNVIDFNNKVSDTTNGIDTKKAKRKIYIRRR